MKFIKYIWILPLILAFASCTNLNEVFLDEELSDVTATSESALSAAYNRMITDVFVDHGHLWGLQEYSTDEALLPTRGSDWGDGGVYRAIQEFTWGADNTLVSNNWSSLTNGVTRSLTAIETINNNSGDTNYSMYLAEAKALLYMYTYYTLDLYGQCPMKEPISSDDNVYVVHSTYIDTLITNVENIIPDLASLGDNSTYNGRFTKEAAYAFLAEMYMNRAVFKDRYNATSNFDFTEASVNNSSKTDMDMVAEYSSMLISSSKFSLEENYFDNFAIGNSDGSELIFTAPQHVDDGSVNGQNDFAYMPMERAQHPAEGLRGTNATCTTPEYYATWDDNQDDPRFVQKYEYDNGTWFYNNQTQSIPLTTMDYVEGQSNVLWFHFNRGFMVGQQYGPTYDSNSKYVRDTVDGVVCVKVSALKTDKNDSMLVFTPNLDFSSGTTLPQNKVHQGVRIFKFEYDPIDLSSSTSRVYIPIFRLGYIYTLRAEAYYRSGETQEALDDINMLRTSRTRAQPEDEGGDIAGKAISLNDLTEERLYNEISYENYWEMKRRPQMIRFGTFDNAYTGKAKSDSFRRLYPIPQSVIDVSGDIFSQNEGYD
jgi:starch-binding outer membrane protein, SusD/RagB family